MARNDERAAFQQLNSSLNYLQSSIQYRDLRPNVIRSICDFLLRVARLNTMANNSMLKEEFMTNAAGIYQRLPASEEALKNQNGVRDFMKDYRNTTH